VKLNIYDREESCAVYMDEMHLDSEIFLRRVAAWIGTLLQGRNMYN
jgi:hypothetical protein